MTSPFDLRSPAAAFLFRRRRSLKNEKKGLRPEKTRHILWGMSRYSSLLLTEYNVTGRSSLNPDFRDDLVHLVHELRSSAAVCILYLSAVIKKRSRLSIAARSRPIAISLIGPWPKRPCEGPVKRTKNSGTFHKRKDFFLDWDYDSFLETFGDLISCEHQLMKNEWPPEVPSVRHQSLLRN